MNEICTNVNYVQKCNSLIHGTFISQKIIGVKKSGGDKSLELFAEGDPLKPQAFYPLENTVTLQRGMS